MLTTDSLRKLLVAFFFGGGGRRGSCTKIFVLRNESWKYSMIFLSDAGDGLVELRKLEAAEEIAHNLSQSPNVVYLPQGQNLLLNVPQ